MSVQSCNSANADHLLDVVLSNRYSMLKGGIPLPADQMSARSMSTASETGWCMLFRGFARLLHREQISVTIVLIATQYVERSTQIPFVLLRWISESTFLQASNRWRGRHVSFLVSSDRMILRKEQLELYLPLNAFNYKAPLNDHHVGRCNRLSS